MGIIARTCDYNAYTVINVLRRIAGRVRTKRRDFTLHIYPSPFSFILSGETSFSSPRYTDR